MVEPSLKLRLFFPMGCTPGALDLLILPITTTVLRLAAYLHHMTWLLFLGYYVWLMDRNHVSLDRSYVHVWLEISHVWLDNVG